MAEIEITTTGELILGGDVVGNIQFTTPFIESEVAGEYSLNFGFLTPDCSADFHCEFCDEKDGEIDDLEEKIARLDQNLKTVIKERDELLDAYKAPEAVS